MGVSLQGNGRGRGRYRPLAEINVTPLVDVMLVLLIIFMVTAPLLSSSVNVDLPKVNATPVNQDNEPLQVAVNAQGQVFLMDTEVQLSELVDKLQAIAKDQKDRRIFVRGDRTNTYGRMMEVMGTIIQGGFTKVSLLTEQVQGRGAAAPATPAAGAAPAPTPGAPTSAPPASATPAPSSSAAPHRQGRG
jgi:biopolymer transport protein TolR